jgi:hypothetical protein
MDHIEPTYNVTLDDGVMRNELSQMSEQNLYGYLRCRPVQADLTAEEVLAYLGRNGSATVYFESPAIPLRTRVEIVTAYSTT